MLVAITQLLVAHAATKSRVEQAYRPVPVESQATSNKNRQLTKVLTTKDETLAVINKRLALICRRNGAYRLDIWLTDKNTKNDGPRERIHVFGLLEISRDTGEPRPLRSV